MNKRGFTLLEVLVAVAVTAILLTTVYGIFTSVSTAKERLETGGEGYHQARVMFDRLGRELRGTYFLPTKKATRFSGGLTEEQYPFLELTTTAATPQGGTRGGIAVVRYELQPDPEADPTTPDDRGGGAPQVLLRQEYNLTDSGGADRPGHRLATDIRELKFRFYDGSQWLEEWDAASQNGLPQMVEVTMAIPIDGQPVPFRSTIEVPRIQ